MSLFSSQVSTRRVPNCQSTSLLLAGKVKLTQADSTRIHLVLSPDTTPRRSGQDRMLLSSLSRTHITRCVSCMQLFKVT